MKKPTVYIASPYSKGDQAINVHFQCKIFDKLLGDGIVTPVAPLWSHFQHAMFPRAYKDWIEYDQSMLHLYDSCLRLNVTFDILSYSMNDSSGADAEVETFKRLGKPVFFSIESLYGWASNREVMDNEQ